MLGVSSAVFFYVFKSRLAWSTKWQIVRQRNTIKSSVCSTVCFVSPGHLVAVCVGCFRKSCLRAICAFAHSWCGAGDCPKSCARGWCEKCGAGFKRHLSGPNRGLLALIVSDSHLLQTGIILLEEDDLVPQERQDRHSIPRQPSTVPLRKVSKRRTGVITLE